METIKVPGFKAAGIHSGIKKVEKDLAMIFSEIEATAAGLFTTNLVKAAPVILSLKRIKSGKGRAIVINSGCANACTGKRGYADALEIAQLTAKGLRIPSETIYVASTGVIGEYLPMDRIRKGIMDIIPLLSEEGLYSAAQAIMTTDTSAKLSSFKEEIGGRVVTIAGIAKGAGMIHPKLALNPVLGMATMLSFILTDAKIERKALTVALRTSIDKSFNKISVDGDTSTNDMVLCLANGVAQNKEIKVGSREFKIFSEVLDRLTTSLARKIVLDGEGATKFIEIVVKGAPTIKGAERIAFRVANSLLVKTTFYGEDPNWGRIMAAIGSSGVSIVPEKICIYINGLRVVENGLGIGKDRGCKKVLKKNNLRLTIELGKGKSETRVWTTDLTPDYVRINARYKS